MDQVFINIIALMALSVFLVWCFKRVGLPAILAYLLVGVMAGPEVLSLYSDPDQMHFLAEVGIVFLLFSLGLEFSLPKLIAMRNLVFGVGAGQMLLTTALFAGIALLLDQSISTSIIIGGMVALSSTAIVIKQIDDAGRLNTPRSQMAVSILLFQDLAVVPFLIAIPLLAPGSEQSVGFALLMALLKGVVVVVLLLSVGRWLLPRIFNEVARTRTDELFVLTTILVALLAAWITYAFGLSMALGAFLAGMMLSESQYRHQLEADIRPFRDILMGLFFITVGMKLELNVLFFEFHWVMLGLIVMVVLKTLVVGISAIIFKQNRQDAWAAGMKLAQLGEFSFVIAALAVQNQVISSQQSSMIISIGLLSMVITPWLINVSGKFAQWIAPNKKIEAIITQPNQSEAKDLRNHVLILGFGRVGQSVARMLKLEGIKYVAIDYDPIRVYESRSAGQNVMFGDVSQRDLLKSAGIENAQLALITFDQHDRALKVVNVITALKPGMTVVVRTRKDFQPDDFYSAGASQVVPEIQEGSLMLVSQVLHYAGVPMSRILKRVRNERKKGYQHMHGFYPGETTEISYGTKDKLEFMHAVVLSEGAFAVNKTINELDIERRRVKVTGLRRNNIEIEEPDPDTLILANDVLVISGKPRRVERIENFLLYGN
ncbi:cation:proton antiporter [Brumicola pallidula]|uniref:Monovalent cation:H+ antiporter-2, CPA2 family n=1 Tax=Brumicola pallidula DSM 14239 = ACAM 615 TaxID=1121922 RepID=K7A2D7_9ALTE|nr:cation:proton antiporter [Glaciecola pallidula]GAC29670.1 monovalent cation:H+ antiporter-2, CPA2 family [Glaciecola pallidula DSM 14239 = ACAM 615]